MSVGATATVGSPAGVITVSQTQVILKMTYDLEEVRHLTVDQLVLKLNTLFKRLEVNEIDTALDLLFKRAISSNVPNLILALIKSHFYTFNFRAKLASSYTPETFDKFALLLQFFINEKHPQVVRECVLSLMKHSIANVLVKNYKTLPNYFNDKLSKFGSFNGLGGVLVSELLKPSTEHNIAIDTLDECTLLYFLGKCSYKGNLKSLESIVLVQLNNLSESDKIKATLRLIQAACLINDEEIAKLISSIIPNVKLETSPELQIGIIKMLIKHLNGTQSPFFIENFTALWNLFPEIDGKPFYYACFRTYLKQVTAENSKEINTLLRYANAVDSKDVYSLCLTTLENKKLYSCVEPRMPFPHLFLTPVDVISDSQNPNLVVMGKDSSFSFNCHLAVIKLKALKLFQNSISKTNDEKTPILKVDISGLILLDILGILYQKFWHGKKFNPDWSLETVYIIYQEATKWELTEVKESCFEFLRHQKYTIKDFDTILEAFSPMKKEDLERLLKENNVFLIP